MRISAHGLDERYTYPCSKSEVRTAFGEALLDGASFGLSQNHELGPRYSPRPRILGTVALVLSVCECVEFISLIGRSQLYVYCVRKDEFDERARKGVADAMKGAMRLWLKATLNRSETAVSGTPMLLVELRGGDVLLHETRYR